MQRDMARGVRSHKSADQIGSRVREAVELGSGRGKEVLE
jgi:hypothetical protein